jgi:hypothetical protein
MRKVYFVNLNVDSEFKSGGNIWVKRSLKTAEIVKPVDLSGKRFYFGLKEVVQVAE